MGNQYIIQLRRVLQKIIAPDQSCCSFNIVAWLWVVSIFSCFIALAVWRFAYMTSVDLTLLYIITVMLLWFGLKQHSVRLFVWGLILVTGVALLINSITTDPAESLLLRYLLGPSAMVKWMALLVLASCAFTVLRPAKFVLAKKLLIASLVISIVSFMLRWHVSWVSGEATGQIPLVNNNDVLLLLFTGLLGLSVWFSAGQRFNCWALVLQVPLALYLLFAPVVTTDLSPLVVPVLQHYWLKIHVPAMVFAWSTLLLAGMTGLGYIIAARRGSEETISPSQGHLYIDVMYRLLAMGVLALSIGLVTGMLWSDLAWGHYLISEPKLAGTLALWFYFMAALHQRLQKNGPTLSLAYWLITGVPLLLFVALGIDVWFDGRHIFI